MLKVGLVGAGHLGKIHLKLLNQSEKYELVGFYDLDEENGKKLNEEFGYKYYNNFDHLLNEIEVLDIVTPTFTHYEYAKKAAESSKHIFVEKPICETIEQAEEIISLTRKNNVLGQVGHVERFNPAYLGTKQYIENPLFLEIHRLAEFNPRGTDVPVVLDLMIHDLDLVLSMIDSKVKDIKANGVSIISNNPDIANARIEFENGCVANVTTSRISMKSMRKCRVFQNNAYISIDFLHKKSEIIKMEELKGEASDFDMIIENMDGKKKKIIFEYPEIEENNAILDELNEFAESIINNKPPKVSLEDGTRALTVALEVLNQINN